MTKEQKAKYLEREFLVDTGRSKVGPLESMSGLGSSLFLKEKGHSRANLGHQVSLEPIQDTLNSEEKRNARLLEVEKEISLLKKTSSNIKSNDQLCSPEQ